jgi:hypothetical protein
LSQVTYWSKRAFKYVTQLARGLLVFHQREVRMLYVMEGSGYVRIPDFRDFIDELAVRLAFQRR